MILGNRTHWACRISVGLAGLTALALCTGCSQITGRSKTSLSASTGQISQEELHEALSEFDDSFVATVKQAAGDIEERTTDAAIREAVLRWQVRTIPACHNALEQEDPIRSCLNLWILCVRLRQYFETGAGKTLFGPHQNIAVTAAMQLETDIESIAKQFMTQTQFQQTDEEVKAFAQSHPLRDQFANATVRSPTTGRGEDQGLFASVVSIPLAPFRAMEGVDRGAAAINRFTNVADHFTDIVRGLPESIRWQAQLLILLLKKDDFFQRSLTSFETFSNAANRWATSMETLPEQMRRQTSLLIDEIDKKQANLQATLKQAEKTAAVVEHALARVDDVALSIDMTGKSVAEAGRAWESSARTIGRTVKEMSELGGDSPSPATQPAAPFDINDYRKTADALTGTAVELQKLATDVRGLIESPQITQHIQDLDQRMLGAIDITNARAIRLTDHIAWRAAQLVALIFGLIVVYRLTLRRK